MVNQQIGIFQFALRSVRPDRRAFHQKGERRGQRLASFERRVRDAFLPQFTQFVLFLLSLFIAPLVGAIPSFATAPALILVGGLMLTGLGQIEWDDPQIGIPAFLTVATIPLTWSIADGLSFGLTSYALLQLLTGRARGTFRRDWMLYLLATLFLLRFIYIIKK